MTVAGKIPHGGLFLLRNRIAIVIHYTEVEERNSDSQEKTGDWGFDDCRWRLRELVLSRQSMSIRIAINSG